MNRHQKHLLEMLREIDSLCRDNGITYFLSGSSLIGALRSEGFLPWDDDAAVMMAFDDYRHFKEVCQDQLPPNRALRAPELQENHGMMLPRYVATDTTCIHINQSLHDDVAGKAVDIFVLDPVADGDEALRAYEANVCMMHEMTDYASIAANRYDVDFQVFEKYDALKQEKGHLAVCQQLEHEKEELFDPEGSRYVFRWQGCLISYPRSWFAEAVEVPFEGCSLLAPIGSNQYLTECFGEEWAELPDVINPAKHNAASSLDIPYDQALEFYRPSYNRDDIRDEMWERKRLVLENAAENNRIRDEVAAAQAMRIKLELERHLAQVQEEFDQAYAAHDGKALAALLFDYLRDQTDKALIGRHAYDEIYRFRKPVMAPVSDKVFEAALWAFMETERMRFAHRFLNIRESQGLPLTAAMAAVRQQLKLFREACNCYQDGQLELGLTKARLVRSRNGNVGAFLKLECVFLERLWKEGGEESLPQLQELVASGKERYPWDGFFVKLEGDMLEAEGDEEGARDAWLVAAEHSRNGFVLKDIAKKTGYWPAWMRRAGWGKSYGIPQWSGPVPSRELPAKPKTKPVKAAVGAQAYLYGLLIQLTELCDANGIDYALSQPTANALIGQGKLPDTIAGYAICCTSQGLATLAELVEGGALRRRSVETASNSATASGGTLLFHGDDSLLLRMGDCRPAKFNSLYVTVNSAAVVKETAQRPNSLIGKIGQKLRTMAKDKASQLSSQSLPERVVAKDGVSGHSFKVTKGESLKGKPPAAGLRLYNSEVVSTSITYADLMATGIVADDFFDRKKLLKAANDQIKGSQQRFKENFRQVKLAVQLKQLSVQLLPKKQLILELASQGRREELANVLAPYIKLVRSYKGNDDLSFDDEIFQALKKVL